MQTLKLTKKYEVYPEYKDSGVEWLGKIPKEWNTLELKYLSNSDTSGIYGDEKNGDIKSKVATTAQLSVDGIWNFEKMEDRFFSYKEYKKYSTKIGDVIVVKASGSATNIITGKAGYISKDSEGFIFGNFLMRVHTKNGYSQKYLYYFLTSDITKKRVEISVSATTYPNLKIQEYLSSKIVFPNLEKQQKIANYLDEKTKNIDQIIEKKQKLIELLREKRTAVINHAVTKGLDPKVELVESGIDWIGKIPKGWNASSLKTLLQMKITDGPHTTPELIEEGVRFISAESIQANNTIDFNKNRGFISMKDHVEFCKKAKPQRGDVFMVKSGATTGRVAIVETDSEFSIWSPLALIRADENKADSKYIYFFLQSGLFQDQVKFSWSFGTQQNIGMRVIENLVITYPSVYIQKDIVEYLESKMPNFDIALKKVEKSIETLQEFKSSLISNVVTGKVKI